MSDSAPTETPTPAPPPGARPRGLWLRRGCGCLGFLVLLVIAALGWVLAYRVGFHEPSPELVEEVDAWTQDLEAPEGERIELSGQGDLHFDRFVVHDLQGHEVLRVGELRGDLDLAALREGVFRLRRGVASGVTLTLRRGPNGRVTLAEVFEPTARAGRAEGEAESEARAPLHLDVEPVRLRGVTIRVEVGERPLRIAVDSALLSMHTRPEGGHLLRIRGLRGRVVEPDLFPQPVRIVDATGAIRLGYGPLVDLKARMCIGRGEVRTRIVLPSRRRPLDLTVDARGVLGVMARLGVLIASARNPEAMRAMAGHVSMAEGAPCTRADGLAEREEAEGELRPVQERRMERREARREDGTRREATETKMHLTRREARREQRSERRGERRADTNGGVE